ncbi:hypothetical protein OG453_07145 [Streptomyces sp. NBC_01381]|uniref:hypothetical protein n=1 Tax=Streptomyces sp. NBC_01381 TaxID=2903845 RepID=UPI00225B9311|nr:hypothetical protein [Streptomyces sp. NBC_01381]MCX4666443.1 hypothetical protein [Streptomyces sp. NBC_01381]
MDEEAPVSMTATCRTPECPVEGQAFTASFYANSEPPTYRGICMRCGQVLTDLVPAPNPAAAVSSEITRPEVDVP